MGYGRNLPSFIRCCNLLVQSLHAGKQETDRLPQGVRRAALALLLF
jgi:hypothetical protein